MFSRVPDPEWVKAVLRHSPTTRHLPIDVMEYAGQVRLQGSVPTLMDRQRAGSIAMGATTPGVGVDNQLRVQGDLAGPLYQGGWMERPMLNLITTRVDAQRAA